MSKRQKYIRLLKDTGVFALGNLGSKLILFFMVPLYTNYMTTDEYGIADLVSTLAELLMPFFSLVIFDAVQRFALSRDERKENVLLFGLFVSTVGGIFLLAATPLLSLYSAISDWKWFLSTYVILSMFSYVEKNYLKAKDMNKLYAALSVAQTFVLATCSIFFIACHGMGIFGYLLATCVSCLVPVIGPFLFGGLIHDISDARLDWALASRMLVFSIPLILNNVSWWAIHSFDKVVLERMLGAAALGVYTVATKIPSLVNVMTSIFSQAWGISSIREFETENDTGYYSSVLKALVLAVFGATLILVSVIKPFMGLYVGSSFEESWRYTPLLLIAAALYSVGSFYGTMYSALKMSINNMVTTVISALICIVVTLGLVPSYGIWGAVVGTTAAYLGLMLARIIDINRFIPIDWGGWRLWISIVVVAAHAIAVSLIESHQLVVSVLAIVLFLVVNRNTITLLFRRNAN